MTTSKKTQSTLSSTAAFQNAKEQNSADSFGRRQFIKIGVAGSGCYLASDISLLKAQAQGNKSHFFLKVFFPNGIDFSALWDARTLDMTKANLIHNHFGTQALKLTGSNGTSTFVTKLFDPLKPYFNDHFSILNGVYMSSNFDGHDQNTNVLFTGNPFGDNFLLRKIASVGTPSVLEMVSMGKASADAKDKYAMVNMTPDIAKQIRERLLAGQPLSAQPRLLASIKERMGHLAAAQGLRSRAAGLLLQGLEQTDALDSKFKDAAVPEVKPTEGEEPAGVDVEVAILANYFRAGITKVGVIVPEDYVVDAHNNEAVKDQVRLYPLLVKQIVKVFETLKNTPFQNGTSLLDHTTVLICSEFGRTMKQESAKTVQESGTDHNPFANSFLIGGKGIKPRCIFGKSDFLTPDEKLSGAHLALDKEKVKTMGQPFDFKKFAPASDLPAEFKLENYLDISNVINTVFKVTGVPQENFMKKGGAGDANIGDVIQSLVV